MRRVDSKRETTPPARRGGTELGLLVVMVGVVVYGSLYPFRLAPSDEVASRLARLLTTFTLARSLGDALGNVILFFPLGFLGARLARDRSTGAVLGAAAVLGALLGIGLQLGQVFVPRRVPALDDAGWNTVGALAGALAGLAVPRRHRLPRVSAGAATLPALLAGCWLAYRLAPFVPALDWQQIKDSLKPLLLHPEPSATDILRSFSGWLAFAALWEELAFPPLRRLPWYGAAVLTLFGEVLVIRNDVTLSNALGIGLALLAWRALRGLPKRHAVVAASLLVALVVLGLEPFEWRPESAPFHWIPFHGFLGGSLLVNAQQLFFKVYLYGGAVWLLARAGWTLGRSGAVVGLLVFAVELGQTRIAGRTPEITDVVLVFLAVWLHEGLAAGPPSATESPADRGRRE